MITVNQPESVCTGVKTSLVVLTDGINEPDDFEALHQKLKQAIM